jgi:hypothetical protein
MLLTPLKNTRAILRVSFRAYAARGRQDTHFRRELLGDISCRCHWRGVSPPYQAPKSKGQNWFVAYLASEAAILGRLIAIRIQEFENQLIEGPGILKTTDVSCVGHDAVVRARDLTCRITARVESNVGIPINYQCWGRDSRQPALEIDLCPGAEDLRNRLR